MPEAAARIYDIAVGLRYRHSKEAEQGSLPKFDTAADLEAMAAIK